jgi:Sulfotransferase family
MAADLGRVLADHCAPLADDQGRPWGWKEPRSVYLLGFLLRQLPALRFVHVVRDGRDMALSTNQNQLRKHADAAGIPPDLAPPARSIALWSWVNLRAALFGAELLGARYCLVRFEDLCASPVEVAGEVLAFAGLDGDAAAAAAHVEPPESLGRWRREDAEAVAELERLGGGALQRFGYETATA